MFTVNPFTNKMDKVNPSTDLSGYFKLDQSIPQTVVSGTPIFDKSISCPGTGTISQKFGPSTLATGYGSTAIGDGALAYKNFSTSFGANSQAGNPNFVGTNNLAFGYLANAGGNLLSTGATAIGTQANSNYNASLAMGYTSTTTADYQFVAGGAYSSNAYITDVYFGSGVTDVPAQSVTFHATGGSGTNIAGANLILAGGIGTGTGVSGAVIIKIAPHGIPGASPNSLVTALVVDESGFNFQSYNLITTGTFGSGAATVTSLTDSGLTASKVVFTDASKVLTSTGIGTSSQFIKGDGSLDSSTYLTSVTPHNLLSATHGDTGASTVSRGDIIVGAGAYPSTLWNNLALGTAGKILRSDGTDLKYSTATYPNTATGTGKVLIADGTNWVASTPTFPNASATVLKYIRSDGANWIASTATISDTPSTALKWLRSDGTNWITSTSTLSDTPSTAGKWLRSDGTNWVTSTPTLSVTATLGTYLRGDGTNWITSTLVLPNAATAYRLPVATSANTIGELAAVGATGEYLAGNTGAIPSWATLNQAAVAGLTTASSPTFTGLTLSGLTSGRVPYATTNGQLTDSANFTFNGTDLYVSSKVGAGVTPSYPFHGNISATNSNATTAYMNVTGIVSAAGTRTLYGTRNYIQTTVSENASVYGYAISAEATDTNISSGKTDSGFRVGFEADAIIANANNQGTLSTNYGVIATAGITLTGVGGAVNSAYGLYAVVYNNSANGTVGNGYGVYIAAAGTGGTYTNTPFGLYQAGANDRNYFAGNVGLNETSPDYRLDVNGTFGFTPGTSVTPVDNGDVVIEATNNTTLTFKLKGSDGTVRSGTLTLA